jgi:hypothetical protein
MSLEGMVLVVDRSPLTVAQLQSRRPELYYDRHKYSARWKPGKSDYLSLLRKLRPDKLFENDWKRKMS